MLTIELAVNNHLISYVEIRRQEKLDLSNLAAIADQVCHYDVHVNDEYAGTVEHRYGDKVWKLVAIVGDLLATRV